MSAFFHLQILAEHNLPVPKTMLIRSKVDVELVDKHLGFPVVVKTIAGSQGCNNHKKKRYERLALGGRDASDHGIASVFVMI
ncbi:hypothetical protein QNH46_14265 [Paenibacillus woosongensis]|uniref:ATP-grasp domain-containing protein n=1 Tax=Paenibacillus woosongensis TaxID=307580 RepID=A0AA95I285_9BACL|nr:hypothetical protein [Paenibacillus woosongensis]WHX47326.1 hypothetical protein QNH46_14265 [Paenibacillus woosongensis]